MSFSAQGERGVKQCEGPSRFRHWHCLCAGAEAGGVEHREECHGREGESEFSSAKCHSRRPAGIGRDPRQSGARMRAGGSVMSGSEGRAGGKTDDSQKARVSPGPRVKAKAKG